MNTLTIKQTEEILTGIWGNKATCYAVDGLAIFTCEKKYYIPLIYDELKGFFFKKKNIYANLGSREDIELLICQLVKSRNEVDAIDRSIIGKTLFFDHEEDNALNLFSEIFDKVCISFVYENIRFRDIDMYQLFFHINELTQKEESWVAIEMCTDTIYISEQVDSCNYRHRLETSKYYRGGYVDP